MTDEEAQAWFGALSAISDLLWPPLRWLLKWGIVAWVLWTLADIDHRTRVAVRVVQNCIVDPAE